MLDKSLNKLHRMKISKETLFIIKSFSDLNINLFFKQGNVIATKNAKDGQAINTVIGRAEVKEEFPIDFGIYNLKEFLGIVDSFSEPDFQFFDDKNFVLITENNYSIKYGFASPDSLIFPKKNSQVFDKLFVEFFLTSDDLKKIKKVGNVLGVKDLLIEGGLTGLSISVCNKEQPSSNIYKIDIPDKDSKDIFTFTFNLDHLSSIINTDYTCKVVSFNNELNFLVLEDGKGLSYYIIHQS